MVASTMPMTQTPILYILNEKKGESSSLSSYYDRLEQKVGYGRHTDQLTPTNDPQNVDIKG